MLVEYYRAKGNTISQRFGSCTLLANHFSQVYSMIWHQPLLYPARLLCAGSNTLWCGYGQDVWWVFGFVESKVRASAETFQCEAVRLLELWRSESVQQTDWRTLSARFDSECVNLPRMCPTICVFFSSNRMTEVPRFGGWHWVFVLLIYNWIICGFRFGVSYVEVKVWCGSALHGCEMLIVQDSDRR